MAQTRAAGGVVSLAYDGGLADHRELVLPILDRLNLKGTFFMPPEALLESPICWQMASQAGHEIGTHSLYGVTIDGALENWNREMVHGDLEMARRLTEELLGRQAPTFVYPGCRTVCADGSYEPVVKEVFATARCQLEGMNDHGQNPYALRQRFACGLTGPDFIKLVEDAIGSRRWLIVAFEGVGAGSRGCDAAAHAELCLWLSKAAGHVPVATVSDAASSFLRARLAAPA